MLTLTRSKDTLMKRFMVLVLTLMPVAGIAEDNGITGLTAHNIKDNRTSLGLSPEMKHRMLSGMRAQLAATQTIIGLLAKENFALASDTARTRLAMPKDMEPIHDAAISGVFNKRGQAFQASTNELANSLQTKDLKKSLQALRKTMGYCVSCHKEFRL